MYKLKLGISVKLGDGFAENIKEIKESGFDSVDLDLCGFWSERDKEIKLYEKLEEGLETIKNSGLYFNAVHISFGVFWDFSAQDENERKAVVLRTKEIFSKCNPYSPFCYVIHGSFEGFGAEYRKEKTEQLKKSLCELRKLTSAKICVETLPRMNLGNTSEELCEIVDSVNGIDVCIDVNHLLYEKPEDAVLKLGNRIKTTHISDYDFVNERHWLPGEGDINWKNLIQAFEKIGYNGVWNYELSLTERETIIRDRDLTYKDIKRNFDELFNGKTLTVIGKRKENLGFWG